MPTNYIVVKLGDIATLQFGLYATPVEDGNTAYIQARHIDEWGNLADKTGTFVKVEPKNESHLLEDGDILLMGKGVRNTAWTYHKPYGPAVASSVFFVIKTDRTRALPAYLALLFNQPQSQAYFQSLGAGTSMPSIRKSELEAFPVSLPSLEWQQKAITIQQLHYRDLEISRKIISEKHKAYLAVINKIINKDHE